MIQHSTINQLRPLASGLSSITWDVIQLQQGNHRSLCSTTPAFLVSEWWLRGAPVRDYALARLAKGSLPSFWEVCLDIEVYRFVPSEPRGTYAVRLAQSQYH